MPYFRCVQFHLRLAVKFDVYAALTLELGETRIQRRLLAQERITPDIRLKHGLDRGCVIADNFLLDEEDRDVGRNGHLTHGDVSEERRFSDTVPTDETVPTTVRERERGTRAVERLMREDEWLDIELTGYDLNRS